MIKITVDEKAVYEREERLSAREIQVASRLVAGMTPFEVAVQLSLSPKTISTYRDRVTQKLDVQNTAEMIAYFIWQGLAKVEYAGPSRAELIERQVRAGRIPRPTSKKAKSVELGEVETQLEKAT